MPTKVKTLIPVMPTAEDMQQAADAFEAGLTIPAVPVITSPALFEQAGGALKSVKDREKELDAALHGITDPLNAALKAARALFAPIQAQLADRETRIKAAILEWNRRVERQRLAEQARLDELNRLEREKAEKKAAKLAAAGKVERAEAVLEAVAPASIVVMDAPKVSGIVSTTRWAAEVLDLFALVEYAANEDEADWLLPNMPALNSYARAMKDKARLPGVRFVATAGISAGSN